MAAQASPSKEYKVKAGFIYNFTKFVEWPQKANPFTICILGENNFAGALKAIESKSSGSTTYRVLQDPASLASCTMVYTEDPGISSISSRISALRTSPVLTVVGRGNEQGDYGVISFVEVDKKMRLVINQRYAESVGLKIDPQLLEVALRVVK